MAFNIYVYGAAALAALGGIYIITDQGKTITNLNKDKGALTEQISSLQGQLKILGTERDRISNEMASFKDKQAEIEVRYITKKVPVYKEIVKTVPEQVVTVESNKDFNEALNGISSSAIAFYSLRSGPKAPEGVPTTISSGPAGQACPPKP